MRGHSRVVPQGVCAIAGGGGGALFRVGVSQINVCASLRRYSFFSLSGRLLFTALVEKLENGYSYCLCEH